MSAVGQRDVAGTEFVVALEEREIITNDVPVLDADGGDELTGRVDAFDVVSGVGQLDEIRIYLVHHAVDRIELRHCIGFRLRVVLRRPFSLTHKNDKKPDVESTRTHLFEIDLADTVQRIDGLGREVERDIVVTVDGDHRVVNDLAGGAEIGLRHLSGICVGAPDHRQQEDYAERYGTWFHFDSLRVVGSGLSRLCYRAVSVPAP